MRPLPDCTSIAEPTDGLRERSGGKSLKQAAAASAEPEAPVSETRHPRAPVAARTFGRSTSRERGRTSRRRTAKVAPRGFDRSARSGRPPAPSSPLRSILRESGACARAARLRGREEPAFRARRLSVPAVSQPEEADGPRSLRGRQPFCRAGAERGAPGTLDAEWPARRKISNLGCGCAQRRAGLR
jgi:hypothetical protein